MLRFLTLVALFLSLLGTGIVHGLDPGDLLGLTTLHRITISYAQRDVDGSPTGFAWFPNTTAIAPTSPHSPPKIISPLPSELPTPTPATAVANAINISPLPSEFPTAVPATAVANYFAIVDFADYKPLPHLTTSSEIYKPTPLARDITFQPSDDKATRCLPQYTPIQPDDTVKVGPPAHDCKGLIGKLNATAGYFSMSKGEFGHDHRWVTAARHGVCSFSVRFDDDASNTGLLIGTEDMLPFLQDSIAGLTEYDRVHHMARTECEGLGGEKSKMVWALAEYGPHKGHGLEMRQFPRGH